MQIVNEHANSQVSNALESMFLAASEAAARRIVAAGWPLTVPARKTLVQRNQKDLDNWWSSIQETALNVIAHRDAPLHKVAPLIPPEVVASVVQCASAITQMPESNLPFWSPFAGRGASLLLEGESGEQPASNDLPPGLIGWVVEHLLLPALLTHLTNLPSLDAASASAAQNFANEVLQVATARELSYLVSVPLAGIDVKSASGAVSAGDGMAIRRLSTEEQGALLEGGLDSLSISNWDTLPFVALEMRVSTPRDTHNPDVRETLAKWLCALQLHGLEPAGSKAILEAQPKWVMAGRAYSPLLLPSRPRNWRTATTAILQRVRATVDRLDRFNIGEPRSERDLALHRFCLGAARATSTDAVLDFVICLESLLLPYDEQARRGDLGYRFRIHGAHYLSNTRKDRKETASRLAGLYELRSRLVHGGKYPAKVEVEDARVVAEQLARRGLLRAVTSGFPTATTFKDMVLGG